MVDLKREYVIPLRKKMLTAPKWRRAKKAVNVLQQFIERHMKCDNIVICAELNAHIWVNGAKNPPGKVKVICLKTTINKEEKVLVNLESVGVDAQLKSYPTSNGLDNENDESKENTKKSNNNDKKIKDVKVVEKKVEDKKVKETIKEEDKK